MTRKIKKLIVYQEKLTGNFFIRATKVNKHGNFVLMSEEYGMAKSRNLSDAELGGCIRRVLDNFE